MPHVCCRRLFVAGISYTAVVNCQSPGWLGCGSGALHAPAANHGVLQVTVPPPGYSVARWQAAAALRLVKQEGEGERLHACAGADKTRHDGGEGGRSQKLQAAKDAPPAVRQVQQHYTRTQAQQAGTFL